MDLARLFPKSAAKKKRQALQTALYELMFEAGWSYEQFCETPLWVIQMILNERAERIKKQNKANKRKK